MNAIDVIEKMAGGNWTHERVGQPRLPVLESRSRDLGTYKNATIQTQSMIFVYFENDVATPVDDGWDIHVTTGSGRRFVDQIRVQNPSARC
jgi:hypothetical protein